MVYMLRMWNKEGLEMHEELPQSRDYNYYHYALIGQDHKYLHAGLSGYVFACRAVRLRICMQGCQVMYLHAGLSGYVFACRAVRLCICMQGCQVMYLHAGLSGYVFACRAVRL